MSNFEKRLSKQDSFCRGCDKILVRNQDEIIYTYSYRNRGQHIMFCLDCAKIIGDMAKSEVD